jgi:hypothetical protein
MKLSQLVPGGFCICFADDWLDNDGNPLPAALTPRKGKVYTMSGSIRLPDEACVVLAEFPNEAWGADYFRPVVVRDTVRFGLLLLPHVAITEPDTIIHGKIA